MCILDSMGKLHQGQRIQIAKTQSMVILYEAAATTRQYHRSCATYFGARL